MTPDDSDKGLRARIENALVPADLCTTDPLAIEKLLDAAKAEPFSDDKVARMLKKLKGEIPLARRREKDPEWNESELTEDEEALVALHKNGKGELPPAIQEKLQRLRKLAKDETEDAADGDQ